MEPIPISLEQYECEACGLKIYINTEDPQDIYVKCPVCSGESKKTRNFDMTINDYGDYKYE